MVYNKNRLLASDFERRSYAFLLGMYLGDGHISKCGRVWRFRLFLDYKYQGLIEQCRKSMKIVFKYNKVGEYIGKNKVTGQNNYVELFCHNKNMLDYFPQHGKGKKHNRKIVIHEWQEKILKSFPEEFLRGLLLSDGSRYLNGDNQVCYGFNNMSDDIARICREYCDMLDIYYTFRKEKKDKKRNIITFYRRDAVAKLDSFVGAKLIEKDESICMDCGGKCSRKADRCKSCSISYKNKQRYSIEWLSSEEILDRLKAGESYLSVGKSIGVSDNAVRKFLKRQGFIPPKKVESC